MRRHRFPIHQCVAAVALAVSAADGAAMELAPLGCLLGTTDCLRTNGTQVSSREANRLLDACYHFTFEDTGLRVLAMPPQVLRREIRGVNTALARAFIAYQRLEDSPLAFDRGPMPAAQRYAAIRQSCLTLLDDFNDETKWRQR